MINDLLREGGDHGWQWARRAFLRRQFPWSRISDRVVIHGLYQRLFCGVQSRVDDFTSLVLGGGIEIGPFVHISSHCVLHSGMYAQIEIGARSTLSAGVQVWAVSDDPTTPGGGLGSTCLPETLRRSIKEPVIIGSDCIIGAGSIILPGARICDGAVVGANSVVLSRSVVASWSIYAGTPARLIAARELPVEKLQEARKIVAMEIARRSVPT